ncbi:DUF262 domain-containing protein [Taklimakanibacter lacteus]|uniref:DUF262 domain-containing protein n=1 Tax=Taklimakanibacter lacteus TaxID=2268456 RepID=UPI000E675105
MQMIQPQYLTLSKLLDARLFRIPEYQRAYSWTSQERGDLFTDILKVHTESPNDGHFMAAIVCLRRSKQVLGTDEYHVVDVVDGQQRITTLLILLNAIKLSLNKTLKNTEAKLAREIAELLVKTEGDELLLLQTNHDTSRHFATYLRKGVAKEPKTAKTIADRELLQAVEDCRAFITLWKTQGGSLVELAALLKNRLYFLLHEVESEKAVYTVFEVLNSRGLDVSWLDRLKSILMGAAFDLKKGNTKGLVSELHSTWRSIYSVIGLRQGLSTEALRFAATLLADEPPSRPLGEKDSVALLRSKASDAKHIREVGDWLLRVTKACDELVANVRINAVTRISQARLLATAILLREDISKKDCARLLARWEKVSFRIYGMYHYDARTRVGDYVRLAWRVVNADLSAKAIDAEIKEIGKEFRIQGAVDELRAADCYIGWENELRYFMYRYEEHLSGVRKLNFKNEQWEKIWMESPSKSIEHIWAKSKAPAKLKHRLGNLVLLPPGLNSRLQDKDPKDKAQSYHLTGLLIAIEAADKIDAQGWKQKQIVDREEMLLKWAAREWAD